MTSKSLHVTQPIAAVTLAQILQLSIVSFSKFGGQTKGLVAVTTILVKSIVDECILEATNNVTKLFCHPWLIIHISYRTLISDLECLFKVIQGLLESNGKQRESTICGINNVCICNVTFWLNRPTCGFLCVETFSKFHEVSRSFLGSHSCNSFLNSRAAEFLKWVSFNEHWALSWFTTIRIAYRCRSCIHH